MKLAEHAKALVALDVASVATISFNNNDDGLVAVEQLGLTRYNPDTELTTEV